MTGSPSRKSCGIYVIWNYTTSKAYVGSSVNIDARLIAHRSSMRGNRHYNDHLQFAYNKYGEPSFSYNVLEVCNPEDRIVREQFWVNEYNSSDERYGYNILKDVRETRSGCKNSEEVKRKISESLKKRWRENPHIMKERSLKMKGKAPPIERSLAGVAKRAKEFKFLSPSGNIVSGKNIAKFSKEHGLPESVMGPLARGVYPPGSFKGWKIAP